MATVKSKKTDVSSVSPSSERFAERQLFYSLRWPSYVFNSVVDAKLPAVLEIVRLVVFLFRINKELFAISANYAIYELARGTGKIRLDQ